MKYVGMFLSLIGAVSGIWGSLMMAQQYHPGSAVAGIVRKAWSVLNDLATGGVSKARHSLDLDATFGKLNPEDRTYSLVGVYLIFWSFLLQFAGAIVTFIAGG